jgi:hypothetical protein
MFTSMNRLRVSFFLFALLLNVGVIFGHLLAPTIRASLDPQKFILDEGNAFKVVLRSLLPLKPFVIVSDSLGTPQASGLQLLENGHLLGPPHSLPRMIRQRGSGMYSHLVDALYFSSSDGSDPRTNGYTYSIHVPSQLHVGVWIAAWFFLSISIVPFFPAVVTILFQSVRAGLGLLGDVCKRGLGHLTNIDMRSSRSVRLGLLLVAVALNIALALAAYLAPPVQAQLASQHIIPDKGYAYVVSLAHLRRFLYILPLDDAGAETRSSLQLFENGRSLGPPHCVHMAIQQEGGGRFSHWGDYLLFSSSDGSDPRTNGYRYEVRGSMRVQVGLWMLGVGLLIAGVLLASGKPAMALLLKLLLPYRTPLPKTWLVYGIVLSLVLAWMITLHRWHTGTTTSLLVAGTLPVSDAFCYWSCAHIFFGMSNQDHLLQNDWCFRRAIYPNFLATLLALSNWHMATVLLLQGALVVLAIFSLCFSAIRLVGLTGSGLMFMLLFSFATKNAFPLLMTEVIGLIAGTVALALLLQGANTGKSGLLCGGMALLSIGMAARAGAMLVLPAVLFWVATYVKVRGFRWVIALSVFVLALSAGFGLQALILALNGASPKMAFGNFATTLYRMSIGAENWSAALSDHPELFASLPESEAFQMLYRNAFHNLLVQPSVFLLTYLKEAQQYMTYVLGFGYPAPWHKILITFFLLGFVRCIWGWRNSWHRLLALATAAELVSAPLIVGDGADRVFAASIGIRAVVTALGFAVLVQSAWSVSTKRRGKPINTPCRELATRDPKPWLAISLGCVIVMASLLPNTPLLNFARLGPLPPPVCAPGQEPVVARLDRESLTLGVVNERSDASVFPVRLPAASLKAGTAGLWFGDEFFRLEPGTLVIQAVNRTAKNFGQIRTLLWRGSMPASGSIVQLCVDPADSIALAEVPYASVRWISELKSY